jgi:hypothetical protein
MSTSISARQIGKVLDTIEEKGVTGELVQNELLGKGRLADLAEAIVRGTVPDRETLRKLLGLLAVAFRFIVDYTLSLSDMIKAGKYDWVNGNITDANFPRTKGKGLAVGQSAETIDAELIHFNRDISSDSAVAEMDKMGYRPATIEELLAFGASNPDIQKQFPIVALGSSCVVHGSRRVVYLHGDGSERALDLSWWDDDWRGDYQFLAVRK